MPGRAWLRHPPRTIRSRPCPTRLPRFTNRWLALASIPAAVAISPTPVQCAECGGWHLTPGWPGTRPQQKRPRRASSDPTTGSHPNTAA
jgi:hypothetical protein